jgi:malonyl CoA-acyl carrier protein transacylase
MHAGIGVLAGSNGSACIPLSRARIAATGHGAGTFRQGPPSTLRLERDVDRLLGYSMRNQCLRDPGDRLNETQFTQPCLYVVNALYYCEAASRGIRPTYVAGHSLGEYSALLAAGCFDFMTGLQLVKRRGELMVRAKNGAMATSWESMPTGSRERCTRAA